MEIEEELKLNDQISLGESAKLAWNKYFVSFVDRKNVEIIEEFSMANPLDTVNLQIIKFKQLAIEDLCAAIKSDIESGIIAKTKLEKVKDNE